MAEQSNVSPPPTAMPAVHLHHETTQCFIKQSRDFCILANERSEVRVQLL